LHNGQVRVRGEVVSGHLLSMPIPAGPTSHAHFASTTADGIHYDLASGAHREIRWPIRLHDQVRNLQYDSKRTVRHQSHLTLAHNSKQATPAAFEPRPPAGCPNNGLPRYTPPAVVTDELTPSK
jgi:hypothetical protein